MLVELFHFVTSFILRFARARSSVGVFCVFLMNPCSTTSIWRVKAQDEPGYPLARKRRTHFPKTIFNASHQRSPNRPAELHPHEVEPDSVPVSFVEAAQPIEHRGPARFRAVKPDRHLRAWFISPHLQYVPKVIQCPVVVSPGSPWKPFGSCRRGRSNTATDCCCRAGRRGLCRRGSCVSLAGRSYRQPLEMNWKAIPRQESRVREPLDDAYIGKRSELVPDRVGLGAFTGERSGGRIFLDVYPSITK